MENNKKSFILHLDSLEILDDMNLEQKGILFDAIRNFHLGIETDLDFGMKMAFAPFKNQFIRDNEKYSVIVERNKSNGSKGGRPPKESKEKEAKKPTGLFGLSEKPKKADNDNDNESDNDNDNEKKK